MIFQALLRSFKSNHLFENVGVACEVEKRQPWTLSALIPLFHWRHELEMTSESPDPRDAKDVILRWPSP